MSNNGDDVGPPYFGEAWPSGICDTGLPVPTPVGEECNWCQEKIVDGDRGTFIMNGSTGKFEPVHRECSMRMVLGGIGHLEDHERWCTRDEHHDPDGGRTPRQSALEVWEWVQRNGFPTS